MAAIDKTDDDDFLICWARGDDDPKTFTIRNEDGTAKNISTWTLSMAVNSEKNPTTTTNEIFQVAGVFVTDGSDGKISFTPPANSLDSVIPASATKLKAYYDINRVTPSKKTLIKGVVEILQDIDKS